MTFADAATAAPAALRIVLLLVLLALGVPLGVVGTLGWRQRLAREGRLGVRTTAAMRSDDAFRLANRVAGLPVLVAGVVAVFAGIAAFLLPNTVASVVATGIGLVGAVAIARAGGIVGDRAAGALPKPVPPQCAGCACGGCAALGG
ncbi:MAG TPA: SdpI family protein [Pseudonocardiaceae bacterium]